MFNKDSSSTSTLPVSNEKKAFLSAAHPEIFTVAPRRGGYLKWVVAPKSKHLILTSNSDGGFCNSYCAARAKSVSNYKSNEFAHYLIPREYKLNYTLEGSNCETGKSKIESDNFELPINDMLAATINCVMLMASEVSGISEKCLTCAESYLTSIKNEDKEHPPNVQGILNHIRCLRSRKLLYEGSFSTNSSSTYIHADESRSNFQGSTKGRKFTPSTVTFVKRPNTVDEVLNYSRLRKRHPF